MAKVIAASDPHAAWTTMSVRTILNIFIYGLIVGVVTYALYLVFERFIFQPILCNESAALARCESRSDFASGLSIVLTSMLGLVLLVRERVYRPILAILGVGITLWSLFSLVASLPLIASIIVVTLLFAIGYVLFSWLVQPTSLLVSITGVIIVVVLARLAVSL